MLQKIKSNKLIIIIIFLLLLIGISAIVKYKKEDKLFKAEYKEMYNDCKNGLLDDYVCSQYSEPLKNRDALSTFGYITLVYSNISQLQILAPLLIIIISSCYFHKYLRKGFLKNSLTRIGYSKIIKKLYFKTLRYSLILPVFLLTFFIICCFISGNFDYKYTVNKYGFDAFGIYNTTNILLFMIIYLLNFIIHGIFWINIGVYNCKHNKNCLISIVVSYIEYLMIFIIFEIVFSNIIFAGTEYVEYFSLSNIWAYSNVTLIGMTLFSLVLLIISTLFIYLNYKNKEKILVEIDK